MPISAVRRSTVKARHAVKSDGCQQERQDSEQHGEPRDHPIVIEAIGDLLTEGLKLHDGEIRIDLGKSGACESFDVVHGTLGFDHNRTGI